MEIKGLQDKLGITDEQIEKLKELKVRTQMQDALLMMNIWKRGGNIHNVNVPETIKRRKANKVARKQRRVNRVR